MNMSCNKIYSSEPWFTDTAVIKPDVIPRIPDTKLLTQKNFKLVLGNYFVARLLARQSCFIRKSIDKRKTRPHLILP